MAVCIHTPLPEVVELMRLTSADVNTGNRGVSQITSCSTPERQTRPQTSTSSSSGVVVPDIQVPSDSPWLVDWCANAANNRDTSLVLRLEALHFLSSFVKSYVFLARYTATNNLYCYIPRLSHNKTSTVIGWFLVTCSWSNTNVSRPGYNSAVVVL